MKPILEATPSEVEKIPTRKLLSLRDDCYKLQLRGYRSLGDGMIEDENGVLYDGFSDPPLYTHYRIPEGHVPNPRFDSTRPVKADNQKNHPSYRTVSIKLEDILYELNKRPHVPGAKEARALRQAKAKTGRNRGKHDR